MCVKAWPGAVYMIITFLTHLYTVMCIAYVSLVIPRIVHMQPIVLYMWAPECLSHETTV